MAETATVYDLVLMLDLEAEDDVRAKVLADARAAITAQGTLVGEQQWGVRTLAYPIAHRTQAEYHLLQFTGPPTLIEGLEHALRIDDGVVRHRVIKQPRVGRGAAADAAAETRGSEARGSEARGSEGRGSEPRGSGGGRSQGGRGRGESDRQLVAP
jgi:small subunit ribosomal protein S6